MIFRVGECAPEEIVTQNEALTKFDRSLLETKLKKSYNHQIRGCCGSNRGRLDCNVSFGKEIYSPGERANCFIEIDNTRGQCPVKKVSACLKQVWELNFDGKTETQSKEFNVNYSDIVVNPAQTAIITIGSEINDQIQSSCNGRHFKNSNYLSIGITVDRGWWANLFFRKIENLHQIYIMKTENVCPFESIRHVIAEKDDLEKDREIRRQSMEVRRETDTEFSGNMINEINEMELGKGIKSPL